MLILGVGLSIPACLLAAWAPTDEVLAFARIIGGVSAGMAYPTTLALITALWSGQPRTRADRALVGDRWRDLFARPTDRRVAARTLLVGFGVPRHPAAGRCRFGDGDHVRPGARQRGDRPRRQPRRDPLDRDGREPRPGHQLRTRPRRWHRRDRSGSHRGRSADGLRRAPTAGPFPPLRPRRREPTHLLGRRARRHHRVRFADGRDVHRAAVPPERARVLPPRGGRGDPPGGSAHGDRGTARRS